MSRQDAAETGSAGGCSERRRFWEEGLGSRSELAGTEETGLSPACNRACNRLRESVLERELARPGVSLAGVLGPVRRPLADRLLLSRRSASPS